LLFMGMVEACAWDFVFLSYNSNGANSLSLSIIAAILNTVKRAMSRMLVLVVSMGYGVVKPTLGDRVPRVLLVGVSYFVFGTLLEVLNWIGHSSDFSVMFRLLFVLPVAALDSTFAVWIFVELSHTVTALHARRQTAKLQLYNRFTRAMAVFILLSVLWSGYEIYTAGPNGNLFDARWRAYWILEGFWPALYFAVLLGIMLLWAPSKNALRYAHSEELSLVDEEDYLEDNGEDQQLLATVSDTKKRRDEGDKERTGGGKIQKQAEPAPAIFSLLDEGSDGETAGKMQ